MLSQGRDVLGQIGVWIVGIEVPGDLIGTTVDVRADKALVKIFSGGQLVKVHPRQKPGARVTDPADRTCKTVCVRGSTNQRARL